MCETHVGQKVHWWNMRLSNFHQRNVGPRVHWTSMHFECNIDEHVQTQSLNQLYMFKPWCFNGVWGPESIDDRYEICKFSSTDFFATQGSLLRGQFLNWPFEILGCDANWLALVGCGVQHHSFGEAVAIKKLLQIHCIQFQSVYSTFFATCQMVSLNIDFCMTLQPPTCQACRSKNFTLRWCCLRSGK